MEGTIRPALQGRRLNMTSISTHSASETYTRTDISKVIRRFLADIVMIAQSSGAITESQARDYAHDVEELALYGYLSKVDLTLFDGYREVKATQYVVNTDSGDLSMSRPGGVRWPRVATPYLQIILYYSNDYDNAAKESMKKKLRINWMPTNKDTSHSSLIRSNGRDYSSNGWGMQRTDFTS